MWAGGWLTTALLLTGSLCHELEDEHKSTRLTYKRCESSPALRRYAAEWQVKEFAKMRRETGEWLESSLFGDQALEVFKMRLYPNGTSADTGPVLQLMARLRPDSLALAACSLLDKYNTPAALAEARWHQPQDESGQPKLVGGPFLQLVPRLTLSSEDLLVSGSLVVLCRVNIEYLSHEVTPNYSTEGELQRYGL